MTRDKKEKKKCFLCVVFFPSERQLYNFLLVQISFPPLSLSLSLSLARARARKAPSHRSLSFFLSLSLTDLDANLGEDGNCFLLRIIVEAVPLAAAAAVGAAVSPTAERGLCCCCACCCFDGRLRCGPD